MGMLQSMKEYEDGKKDTITTSWDETQQAVSTFLEARPYFLFYLIEHLFHY